MKIGFIGAGKMATALVNGIVSSKLVPSNDVFVTDINADATAKLKQELNVSVADSAENMLSKVDIVITAVGPKVAPQILSGIKDELFKDKTVVSIAAGLQLDTLAAALPAKTPIVRIMPNINAVVGEAAIALCTNDYVEDSVKADVKKIFESVGTVYELPESQFSIFTAISGSSPAYAYLFIDSIARGAVKNGMNKDLATKIAAEAVLGSAKMIKETGEEPWTLINNVSSPGGTTVAGLVELEDNAFISTVIKGIDATINKDKELSGK
ncbi:pyrroline-5-carboxylate reductase [Companilactobacillus mishanensis]|uniref:Pyrroline-5-carboxylate reductase n=1 Tax=Companilactobacillus mishanensis TaxID=2486008 RepID=A0ABW9P3N2_9LACO|nr:pyrroline-5-carboxylate reductase [Companilactobacillus mishanensis]MQS43890.1 pyrroline-5-carboxylate reductase [Companilactobacillus mishanensis]